MARDRVFNSFARLCSSLNRRSFSRAVPSPLAMVVRNPSSCSVNASADLLSTLTTPMTRSFTRMGTHNSEMTLVAISIYPDSLVTSPVRMIFFVLTALRVMPSVIGLPVCQLDISAPC